MELEILHTVSFYRLFAAILVNWVIVSAACLAIKRMVVGRENGFRDKL